MREIAGVYRANLVCIEQEHVDGPARQRHEFDGENSAPGTNVYDGAEIACSKAIP